MSVEPPPAQPDDRETGLPVLRSWGGVYAFVFGTFVLWVLLLTVLTAAFS